MLKLSKSRSNMFDYHISYDDLTNQQKGDYIDFITRKDLFELYLQIKEELSKK